MGKRKLIVEGMKCEKCEARTKSALLAMPGVTDVVVDREKGKVVVTCDDSISDEDLCMTVIDLGFKAKVKHGLF